MLVWVEDTVKSITIRTEYWERFMQGIVTVMEKIIETQITLLLDALLPSFNYSNMHKTHYASNVDNGA